MNFTPGLELSHLFFVEAVQPIVDARFPVLPYSAALIGDGSEVLGFDTIVSTDHHWGPRVLLFVLDEDHVQVVGPITQELSRKLPPTFRGYSTNFSDPDPTDHGTQLLTPGTAGAVRHRVDVLTIRGFVRDWLAFDLSSEVTPSDWLTFPEQKLLALTSGAVFRDDIGLQATRDRFSYYPRDAWLYQLAATWTRIGQEEHLMGRAGQVGDEVGSALIAARLVRDLMRLCFLYERTYAPYAKWFGTAFDRLSIGPTLGPVLRRTLSATTWQGRERELVAAYEIVATLHNRAQLTSPLPIAPKQFFSRPFKVIAQHGFAEAIRAAIADPVLARLPLIGGIDLISDNTDLVTNTKFRRVLRSLYD